MNGMAAAGAADLRLKAAPPVVPSFNWAGAYVGLNAGGVWDRNDLGQVRLTSPGFVFVDPGGAFAGFPTAFFGIPGAFMAVPANQSGPGASFIGGGQAGYNWQSGPVVYGVEGDVQGMNSRQTISATLAEVMPGVIPAGNISRTTTGNFSIQRDWQASLRGRVGYAWDRFMVYGTGGIAFTSLRTGSAFTYAATIGPALAPFPLAPPQNFSAQGGGAREDFVGVTIGGGAEYALTNNISIGGEYRYTDFGKRNLTLGVQPAAGVLLPDATPIQTTVHLFSHQAMAKLNYRFGEPREAVARNAMAMATKAPIAPVVATNWSGCYAGGFAGGAWSRGTADTFDPSINGPSVFGPPPFVQSPFYSGGLGLASAPAPYGYNLGASGIGGGTLGCNWQAPASRLVLGAEAEGGFMRLSGSANDPFNVANGFTDHIDSTKIGDWYGVLAGRLGYSIDKTLLYLKGGAGFTRVSGSSIDTCSAGPTCSGQVLNANGSASPAFFVAGGGAEWAFAQKWSVKAEYLYLGLHQSFAVCGPGGGGAFLPSLTFCADHRLNGVHTAKIGVNYKLY